MAPSAAPYGREDLPQRTTVEPVGHDTVAVMGTRQVREQRGGEAVFDQSQVDLQVG